MEGLTLISAQETLAMEDAVDRLIAAVLRLATIDYIKVRRRYNKGLLTEAELENERKIYTKCIDNWTPYTYDVINSEYMITECDRIALSKINVDKMGAFRPAGTEGESNDESRRTADNIELGV